jgi:hypothetical protein
MPYITRRQVDREIESMMLDCRAGEHNTYHFPKFGNLSIKLKPKKTIRDWVVKYIEQRNNLSAIERIVNA